MSVTVWSSMALLLDCVLILSLFVYLYTEGYSSVKTVIIRCCSLLISFFSAIFLYPILSPTVMNILSLSPIYASAFSFFIIAGTIISLFFIFSILFIKKVNNDEVQQHPINIPISFITFFLFIGIFFQILFASGVGLPLKNFIGSSKIISYSINMMQNFEQLIAFLFGKEHTQTMQTNYLTNTSTKVYSLPFTSTINYQDEEAEKKIFSYLNAKRKRNNLPTFENKKQLSAIARNYAKNMIENHFFSYKTPAGYSLVDEINKSDIYYLAVDEFIVFSTHEAFSEIALNSSENKKALLSPQFLQIGIGVQNVPPYGKVIVIIYLE